MAQRKLFALVLAVCFFASAHADILEDAKSAIRLKNYESAVQLLSKQPEPAPAAEYLLGTLYLAGLGVAQNEERAQQLFESAAQQGEPRAAFALAGLLANREKADVIAATRWLDRAAELRYAPAIELKKRNELPLSFRPQTDLNDEGARHDAFWYAIAIDDVATLASLSNPKWILEADEFARTPLHRAAERGATNSVAWLLKKGVSVDAVDRYGVTPLMLAAASSSNDCLKQLLNAHANVAAVDEAGNGALVYAARNNQVVQLKTLLDSGASLGGKNKNGWSAIDYALQSGAKDAADLLRAGGVSAVRNAVGMPTTRSVDFQHPPAKTPDLYSGWSDVAIAVTRDDPALIEAALGRGSKLDASLVMVAVQTQSPKSVSTLTQKGVEVTHADTHGKTPLIVAIDRGDEAAVRALLAGGAKPEAEGKNEMPPLIAAIQAERATLVRELLEVHADANVTWEGATALMIAAQRGQQKVIDALLNAHASADSVDGNGRSALWFAARAGHSTVVAALLNAHANIDSADQFGVTPLLAACARGHDDVVEQLLSAGANSRGKTKSGDTPLIAAASNAHFEIVQRLVRAKVDIDAQNARGDTALIAASRAGHEQVVSALLQAGASKKLRNNEKIAAEDVARARGFDSLAMLIDKR